MPPNWDLYIVHGKSFLQHAKDSVKGINRTIFFIPLQTDNLTANEYNYLFKQLSFWNKIDAENILVFQTDASLCGKSTFDINDFINYDYIGCPYGNGYGKKLIWKTNHKDEFFYGIGGLSFRKKSFMKQCILKNEIPKHYKNKKNYPEDIFFSNCVDKHKKPKSLKKLQQFCTQNKFTRKSFGAHKTLDIKKSFYNYCPEAKELIK
jgi:hypothetical protein